MRGVGREFVIKKWVFVSHPFANAPAENRRRVDVICKEIAKDGRYLPISPLHLFSFYDTEDPCLREQILEVCFKLIKMCDEVWVFGDSPGCKQEANYAFLLGKPVRYIAESPS